MINNIARAINFFSIFYFFTLYVSNFAVIKFFHFLLKDSGYALEQVMSPLVVATSDEHEELKAIARQCHNRRFARHYLGFGENQWRLFEKKSPPRVKPLLYIYRVLLTGIHLMQSGELECNLPRLNEIFRISVVDDLIAMKTATQEQIELPDADLGFYRAEYDRLRALLSEAESLSPLPESVRCSASAGNRPPSRSGHSMISAASVSNRPSASASAGDSRR